MTSRSWRTYINISRYDIKTKSHDHLQLCKKAFYTLGMINKQITCILMLGCSVCYVYATKTTSIRLLAALLTINKSSSILRTETLHQAHFWTRAQATDTYRVSLIMINEWLSYCSVVQTMSAKLWLQKQHSYQLQSSMQTCITLPFLLYSHSRQCRNMAMDEGMGRARGPPREGCGVKMDKKRGGGG